jgi:hypothetical protein
MKLSFTALTGFALQAFVLVSEKLFLFAQQANQQPDYDVMPPINRRLFYICKILVLKLL